MLPCALSPLGTSIVHSVRNPYVTDGLIAMWDGEWNTGELGTHDGSATKWTDMIAGKSFTLPASTSFGDKWFYISKSNISMPAMSFANSSIMQIEFIGRNETPAIIFFVTAQQRASLVSSGTKLILTNGAKSTANTFDGSTASPTNVAISAGYSSSGATGVWVDGTQKTVSADSASVSSVNFSDTNIRIGGRQSTANSFMGRIYCVRLYNRALSADEVAANYAVDHSRFGV